MNGINFNFKPFGEQLVNQYLENHLEDSVNPRVADHVAGTTDETVAQWDLVEAVTFSSVSKLARYEVQRRVELSGRLGDNLNGVPSKRLVDYVVRQVDLGIQELTLRFVFQDYLKDFVFKAEGEPTELVQKLAEEHGESEGFRKTVAIAYHNFCHDFDLDDAFRDRTKLIVDNFQRAFMRNDFGHFLAASVEAGYKE